VVDDERTCKQLLNRITELENLLLACQSERDYWKKSFLELKTEKETLTSNLRNFLNQDQVLSLSRKNMKFSLWSDKTCEKSIILRYQLGETGYESVRKLVPLPSLSTLHRRLENFCLLPGVNELPIKFLKESFEPFSPNYRRGVLVFDRMSLIEGIEEYQGESFGYDTMKNDKKTKASEGLVGLFAGTIIRLKQIIGYHLTEKSVDSAKFKKFLFELLWALEGNGIFVDGLVMDIGHENLGLLNALGISLKIDDEAFFITHPCDPERKLWIVIDSVHEFKNIGNHFRTKDAEIPQYYVEKYNLSSKFAKSSDIKKIQGMQKKMSFKAAPKLNENICKPGQFEKMRVNTHTRFFSSDISSTLEFLLEDDLEDAEKFLSMPIDDFLESAKKNSTVFFVSVINRWISTLKNRHEFNLQENSIDEVKSFLRECCEIFHEIKIGPTKLRCLIAAEKTTKSILDIMEYYQSLGVEKFCAANFTQDCLENVYSVVRSKKKMPTSKEFVYLLRAQCVSRFTKINVRGSSYDLDESTLNSHVSFLHIIRDQEKTSTQNLDADLDLRQNIENLGIDSDFDEDFNLKNVKIFYNELELNVFYYVCGYLVDKIFKKFHCTQCHQVIVDTSPIPTTYNRLVRIRDQGGKLTFVSDETFNYILKLERIFQAILTLNSSVSDQDFKEEFVMYSLMHLSHQHVHCFEFLHLLVSNFIGLRLYLTRSPRNKHTRSKYSSSSMR
jgi:hypothetical protein